MAISHLPSLPLGIIQPRSDLTPGTVFWVHSKGYRQSILYSDFWKAYRAVLPHEQHRAVGKSPGLTAHVERFNNTLR